MSWSTPIRKSSRRAFTLVELLVVIGIIALLISILLPALSRANNAAKRTKCMAQMRELTMAWTAYAMDSRGWLVDPNTGTNTGWANAGNTAKNITQGVLFPYCPHKAVDHCPADYSNHLRSYSINDYFRGYEGSVKSIDKLSQIRRSSDVFVFVEEFDPRGFNLGGFLQLNSGDVWVDYPAVFHLNGVMLSFADGHCDYYVYKDARTSRIIVNNTTSTNNPDLKWFEAHVGY
jgi:prepilin-type N-terminal cleavage/methylation domain-containing protein/prepilin-type processing-associated H-X9-DG protein